MVDWANLQNVWQDPWFQAGVGMLSANRGPSGGEAFQNALAGGMQGMLRGQTITGNIERQKAATQLAEQQQQQRAMQLEQQRRLAAAAPQLAPALLSEDPQMRRQAAAGIAGIMPEALPGMIGGALARPPSHKPTSLMQNLASAGFIPGTPEYEQAMLEAVLKPQTQIHMGAKAPAGFYAPTGDPREGVERFPGSEKPPSQAEQVASGYVTRMIGAEQELNEMFGQYSPAAISALESSIGGLARMTVGSEAQRAKAAQDDWIRAKLRKESGAVIGEQEMTDERAVYFDKPGDKPETVMLKRRLRETAMQSMAGQAGRAFEGEVPKLDIPVIRTDADLDKAKPGQIVYIEERGEFMRVR